MNTTALTALGVTAEIVDNTITIRGPVLALLSATGLLVSSGLTFVSGGAGWATWRLQ